jgi:cobaltochelatase CobS
MPAGKQFKLVMDHQIFKKGDIATAVQVSGTFIKAVKDGRTYIIPKACLEEIKGTSSGVTMGTATTGTISVEVAEDLKASMGIGDSKEFTNLEAEKEQREKKKKVKLKKNQFWLSSITDGRLPSSGVDHILERNPKTLWSKDALEDIPSVNESHHWDADVLEALWLSYKHNKRVLLTGCPGTGKTTSVIQFAAHIIHPVIRLNGKEDVESASFLGYQWAGKGGMEWKDGLLTQGCINEYIVLIDEVFKIPPGIQMAMQGLYEEGGHLMLDDKPGTQKDKKIIPGPKFRLILTDNVKGTGDDFDKYAGTQVQDTSTLDRFDIVVDVDYLPEESEVAMLIKKFPEMSKSVIDKIVQFATLIRRGYKRSEMSVTLSARGLQTVCQLYNEIPDAKVLLTMVYKNKVADSDELDGVVEMFKTVGL